MLCMDEETSLDTAFSNTCCAHSPVRLIKAKKSPNPRSTDVLRLAGYGPLSHQLTSRIDLKRASPGGGNTCARASVIPVNKEQKGLARLDLGWDSQCCASGAGYVPWNDLCCGHTKLQMSRRAPRRELVGLDLYEEVLHSDPWMPQMARSDGISRGHWVELRELGHARSRAAKDMLVSRLGKSGNHAMANGY